MGGAAVALPVRTGARRVPDAIRPHRAVPAAYAVRVTEAAEAVPRISAKALSGALAALGAYAEPPTGAQLTAAELAEGGAGLAPRLASACTARRWRT